MRLTALLVLGSLLTTGCSGRQRESAPLESQVGQNCIVYFRRDALGMAADTPSSVTTGNLNGAEVAQSGELMQTGAEWVVINSHGRVFHIPQSTILMIEFGNNVIQKPRMSEPTGSHHGDHSH